MLRAAPVITLVILAGPILFGLAATLLPAFNYLPVLGGREFSLEPWRVLFATPGLVHSCILSLTTGLGATFISLAIAAGFVAGWSHGRAFRLVQHLLSPLLSVPHAAAAFGLAFLLMPSGWLMRLISPELTGFTRPPDWLVVNDPYGLSLVAGLVAKELPFLLLIILAAMPQAKPRDYMQIATSLGYGRMVAFFYIVWPSLYPQIRLAIFAVIAYSSSVVDVAMILGPTNPSPLAVRLVDWMNDPDIAVRFKASAGAILQLFITIAAFACWIIGEKLSGWFTASCRKSGYRLKNDSLPRHLFLVLAVFAALVVFLGLFVLALWSFAGYWSFPHALPDLLTLENWRRQWPTIGRPLAITTVTGLIAAAIAVALTLAFLEEQARSKRTNIDRTNNHLMALIYLPLIVPQVSFVFGLQMFFLSVGLDTYYGALVLAHLIFVLPYVLLSLDGPWHAWDRRFGQVAQTIGTSNNRIFWRIRAPMLLRTILIASALGFAVSVGQYLPTVLIGAGRWPTITTEAVALASGGNRRIVGIYGLLQMLLPFVAFAIAALVPTLVFARRRDMQTES
jgi:putative thiamine transport system permease protein